jgi:hypothetical protein
MKNFLLLITYTYIYMNIDTIKSTQAPVEESYGHPTLSKYSKYGCCDTNTYIGTPINLLHSTHGLISDYGLPQYSDLNKCYIFDQKDIVNIKYEMDKNNINTEEILDRKYKKKDLPIRDTTLDYKYISSIKKKKSNKK